MESLAQLGASTLLTHVIYSGIALDVHCCKMSGQCTNEDQSEISPSAIEDVGSMNRRSLMVFGLETSLRLCLLNNHSLEPLTCLFLNLSKAKPLTMAGHCQALGSGLSAAS